MFTSSRGQCFVLKYGHRTLIAMNPFLFFCISNQMLYMLVTAIRVPLYCVYHSVQDDKSSVFELYSNCRSSIYSDSILFLLSGQILTGSGIFPNCSTIGYSMLASIALDSSTIL